MTDAERRRKLNRVELVAGQANTHLGPTMHAMTESLAGQPKAQDFDPSTTSSPTWCWRHERDVAECQREGLDCTGETIVTHDATGEVAVQTVMGHDPAAADIARFDRALSDMARAAEIVVDVFTRWRPLSTKQAEDRKEAWAKMVTEGKPGCELCAKAGKWSLPHVEASTCKGNLDKPHRLCVWHHRFIIDTGRKPTVAEVLAHHEGRKLKRTG